MSTISDILRNSKKIVIKVGSHVLSDEEGFVDRSVVGPLVDQVQALIDDGKQVVIVSSGAGVFGVGALGKWHRKGDTIYRQALCAIGQVELMMAYKEFFGTYGTHVAQILLTNEDFSSDDRILHIRNTLFTLIDEGVVPIINENDTVSVDEIVIGDNDTLSARAANLWAADCLVILTDIDGVFDSDPKKNPDATLVEKVTDIDALLEQIDTTGKSDFGTGGMATKISAARACGEMMIPTVLLNGKKESILKKAYDGEGRGTAFVWEE